MSADFERGPLISYEVTWRSGHVETVQAHQVTFPVGDMFSSSVRTKPIEHIKFHGEIDGQWGLILAADQADILAIRRLFSEVQP